MKGIVLTLYCIAAVLFAVFLYQSPDAAKRVVIETGVLVLGLYYPGNYYEVEYNKEALYHVFNVSRENGIFNFGPGSSFPLQPTEVVFQLSKGNIIIPAADQDILMTHVFPQKIIKNIFIEIEVTCTQLPSSSSVYDFACRITKNQPIEEIVRWWPDFQQINLTAAIIVGRDDPLTERTNLNLVAAFGYPPEPSIAENPFYHTNYETKLYDTIKPILMFHKHHAEGFFYSTLIVGEKKDGEETIVPIKEKDGEEELTFPIEENKV